MKAGAVLKEPTVPQWVGKRGSGELGSLGAVRDTASYWSRT